MKFPITHQHDSMQCGVACLQMICKYFGREYSLDFLSKFCSVTTQGVSMLGKLKIGGVDIELLNKKWWRSQCGVQIIVLGRGTVAEVGNHETLVAKHGTYYHLVKNQLELGN